MHDEDDIARGQRRETRVGARHLVDETLAAGWTVTRRRFPELPVGIAKLGDKDANAMLTREYRKGFEVPEKA